MQICKLRTQKTSEESHNAACGTACKEFLPHIIHIGRNVLEEDAITGTKIIEAGLPVGSTEEPKTRAFSVTSLEPQAFAALARKGFPLHATEAVLFCSIEHLGQPVRAYVT